MLAIMRELDQGALADDFALLLDDDYLEHLPPPSDKAATAAFEKRSDDCHPFLFQLLANTAFVCRTKVLIHWFWLPFSN